MSWERFDIPTVTILLQEESIVTALKGSLSGDIKVALDGYLERRDVAILSYILGEEVFEKELYSTLSNDKSELSLKRIFNHMSEWERKSDIIKLENKYIWNVRDLADYFYLGSAYTLNNKQLAEILQEWPDPEWNKHHLIFFQSWVNIEAKALQVDLYVQAWEKVEEDKIRLTEDPKHTKSFQWPYERHILFELDRLFPDKSLYEIFSVDPIDVIKSK